MSKGPPLPSWERAGVRVFAPRKRCNIPFTLSLSMGEKERSEDHCAIAAMTSISTSMSGSKSASTKTNVFGGKTPSA